MSRAPEVISMKENRRRFMARLWPNDAHHWRGPMMLEGNRSAIPRPVHAPCWAVHLSCRRKNNRAMPHAARPMTNCNTTEVASASCVSESLLM